MARASVLGVRTIRRRLTRFALTAIGIALGIGVFFAVLVTNATIDAGLDQQLGRRASPEIRIEPAAGFSAVMPRDVLGRIAKVPGTVDVQGWTGIGVRIPGAPPEDENVGLYGSVHEKGDGKAPAPLSPVGRDIVGEGRDPADGKDEVGLADWVRRQMNAGLGDTVEFIGPAGPVRLKVVQFTRRRDRRPDDARVAWTSYETARRISGAAVGTINGGRAQLAKDTDTGLWIARATGVAPDARLISAEIGEGILRDNYEGPQAALAGLAGVALFVSGFLIFLTLSMSVAEASALHGTLRAIGASRRQVRRVVLTDAIVLTVLAAPLGIAAGLAGAVGMIRVTRTVFDLPNLPVTIPRSSAVIALAVGIGVTFVSALVPARRAAHVAPVVAMRPDPVERPAPRWQTVLGVVLMALGLLSVSAAPLEIDVGSFLVLVGAVLLVPRVMPLLTRIAGAATGRMARGVGTVGVLHLRKEPRRAAYTVALVMVVLSMVFTAGAVHLSLRRNLVDTLAQRFPADLVVNAGVQFDDALQERVQSTPGVQAATELEFTRLIVQRPRAGYTFVTIIDPDTFISVQRLPWSDGSDEALQDELRKGAAVAVPQSLTESHGIRRGGSIVLATPRGPRTFRVAGVYRTFESRSSILASNVDAATLLGGPAITGAMAVRVARDASVDGVKAAIERRDAGAAPLFAQRTTGQKADYIEGQTAFFNIIYVFVLIGLVMGMLGVANTLALAVLRRTREIGILRAVGTERRLLRRMAAVEAATIALAGLLLAVPLGILLSVTVLRTVTDAIGIVVPYVFPWPMFGVVAVAAVAVAVLSSVLPGRSAGRVDPARVLRFD